MKRPGTEKVWKAEVLDGNGEYIRRELVLRARIKLYENCGIVP
jgi:hypothetical protein